MSAAELYPASPINPQRRATKAEMEARAAFLIQYALAHGPVTVRQLSYRATVVSLPGIEKTEGGYNKVQHQVLQLRREGRLAYQCIADNTRWMRKPRTYDSVEQALRTTAQLYRKSLWADADVYVEVWLEKDALAGVIYPVTELFDLPLMVARGYSSETFAYEAIAARGEDPRPYHVYYLVDFDRAGLDAARTLEEKLDRFASEGRVDITFEHLAIEADDIVTFDGATQRAIVDLFGVGGRSLPTREPKRNSPADRAWPHPFACELDAIEPDDLRALVQAALEHYLPAAQLRVLQAAEASERQLIQHLVDAIGGQAP